MAINVTLPEDIGTGFAEVWDWEFAANCHPVIPAWLVRHFKKKGWASTALLTYLVETGILKSLKVCEAILSFGKHTDIWLPES
ncbi:MAG: hypothetical protein ABW157_22280 [Candidatus Thiodiazotropha sp. LLP2]